MPLSVEELKRRIAEHAEIKKTMSPMEYERWRFATMVVPGTTTKPAVEAKRTPNTGPQREDYPHLSLMEFESLPERVAYKERIHKADMERKERKGKEREEKKQEKPATPRKRSPSPEIKMVVPYGGRIGNMPFKEQLAIMEKITWSHLRGKRKAEAKEKWIKQYKAEHPEEKIES